jgi:hypothetical protein
MHADENMEGPFACLKLFLLDVRASPGICSEIPRNEIRSQPMPTTPHLSIYMQSYIINPPGPIYVQHSNSGFGLSVERFEPRERTRSCINDAAFLRDRSSSQLYLVLVKVQECAKLLLY